MPHDRAKRDVSGPMTDTAGARGNHRKVSRWPGFDDIGNDPAARRDNRARDRRGWRSSSSSSCPLPGPPLLDLALATSIILSVLILMTAPVHPGRRSSFSSFPTVLLIATMLRLALNLASTRLILAHGHEGHRRPPAT